MASRRLATSALTFVSILLTARAARLGGTQQGMVSMRLDDDV